MMFSTNLCDYWTKFFEDAQIDKPERTMYVENSFEKRMKPNCLRQLNENHLDKIGITALGDQLSIMDQVKRRISDKAVVARISASIRESKFQIGVTDFRDIVNHNYKFIDKTLIIKTVVETPQGSLLLTAPRRFGKSLNLSILKYFFGMTCNEFGVPEVKGLESRRCSKNLILDMRKGYWIK